MGFVSDSCVGGCSLLLCCGLSWGLFRDCFGIRWFSFSWNRASNFVSVSSSNSELSSPVSCS